MEIRFCSRRRAISFVVLSLLSAGLQAQVALFIPQNQVATGSNPGSFAIADFNGDGKADLAIADQGSATLTVLRGIGNGFFVPFPNQATGISPSFVAVGDFNGDGKQDLAIANFASNNVSVLLGNGNGTFRPFSNLSARGPVSIVVADFNGDGKLDLAVAERNSNSVSIFLGFGTGAFIPLFTVPVGDRPASMAVDDFNGDGILDLAVANSSSNNVSILLGIGNGTFRTFLDFDAGQRPAFVVTGDFNGDGIPDLAVANATGFSSTSISVLLGLGNGVFRAPLSTTAGSNASFLVAGDFNLDGNLDLAVANTGSNTISIFDGIGNGTFLPPLNFTVGNAPDWIGVTDLNGDGKPDLLVANSRSNTVSVLINRTTALAQPTVTSVVNGASLLAGPVAPGELVTILGSNLASSDGQTQVLFDGVPATPTSVSGGQVSVVVPFAVAGQANTQLMVENDGQTSATQTIPVTDSAPGLFTADGSGQGQGLILNADGSMNNGGNPAAAGSVVVLYATGLGQTNPPGVDGSPAANAGATPVLPVTVTIGGIPAQASAAAGSSPGIMQIGVSLPDGVSSGAFPVLVQVGAGVSQPGVTLSVQ